MKTSPLLPFFALVVTFVIGCSPASSGPDTWDKIANDGLGLMKEANSIAAGLSDAASVTAAEPKLDALFAKAEALAERALKLPNPTEAELKALKEKYEPLFEAQGKEIQTTMEKFQEKPDVMFSLMGSVMKYQERFEKLGEKLKEKFPEAAELAP